MYTINQLVGGVVTMFTVACRHKYPLIAIHQQTANHCTRASNCLILVLTSCSVDTTRKYWLSNAQHINPPWSSLPCTKVRRTAGSSKAQRRRKLDLTKSLFE